MGRYAAKPNPKPNPIDDIGTQRIRITQNIDGKNGILVSGSRPVLIGNENGVPFLTPLGMPELPFSNNGTYLLAPLIVGDIRGLASLWVESDEMEGVEGLGAPGGLPASVYESKKQSTLQLYQEIVGLKTFPGSVTTAKKVHSGVTTHRAIELIARSEDQTEQALLKRKTFILSCSSEARKPFLSSVLTEEEKEKEETFYDRFFPTLESFCEPDLSIGGAPLLSSREYKLVIMQSGTAVDEYVFPLGEIGLGLEIGI
jgi:hypothetical protein